MTSGASPASAERDQDVWTVGRVLAWVSKDFAARNLDSPRLEAELLLAHVLGCNRIQLIVDRDRPLVRHELAAYRAMVSRRRHHEPVAYLRGHREFFGHDLRVDPRVLIPRPDTETLVEEALARTRDKDMYGRMADLCTGSGNVAIAFARARPTWRVIGSDISDGAVALARDNAVRLGSAWNVSFVSGDLFEPLVPFAPFDLLTANPPYIPSEDLDTLDPGIRDHEPRLALDGGRDGMDVLRRIVERAPAIVVERGVVAVEIGADQGEGVRELMIRAGWAEVKVQRDLGGRDRVVSAIRP